MEPTIITPKRDRIRLYGVVDFLLFDRDGKLVAVESSPNLITDHGLRYYANRAVGAAAGTHPDDLFVVDSSTTFDGVCELYIGGNDPDPAGDRSSIGGTIVEVTSGVTKKACDSGYPKIADDDATNANAGPTTVTYRFTFGPTEALAVNIDTVVITNPEQGASDKMLMWAKVAQKTHVSGGTMVVRVNHPLTA